MIRIGHSTGQLRGFYFRSNFMSRVHRRVSDSWVWFHQSFIRTAGVFFCGAAGSGAAGTGASSDGSLFETRGAGASAAGRGRGKGGDDAGDNAALCCLALAPVAWLSQAVKSCAISERGEPLSGATCGACAWIDAPVNSRNHRVSLATRIALIRTIIPAQQRAPMAHTLIRIRAVLRRIAGEIT